MVTPDQLKRTGIDIAQGKISITADLTEWLGDVFIKPASASDTQGLILYNYQGDESVEVRNDNLGSLNTYSFTGTKALSLKKSGTKTGSPFKIEFSKTPLNGGARRSAGDTIRLWKILFNASYDSSSPYWGYSDVSSVSATIKFMVHNSDGSDTVRKTFTETVYTSQLRPRSWEEGWSFSPIEYTLTTSEVLYAQMTFNVTCSGGPAATGKYIAYVDYMEYNPVSGLNKLALDTAVFSRSNKEYFWSGNMKWPNRSDEYGIMLRNKQHGIAVTPIGLYRPYNQGNSQSDSYPSEFGNWGDISSTTPCYKSSLSTVNLAATNFYWHMFGVVVLDGTDYTKQTVTLPSPSACPGKWYIIKRISKAGSAWNTTVTSTGGRVFMDCDDTWTHLSYGIGNRASWFYSTGQYWLHFHIGNWESHPIEHPD